MAWVRTRRAWIPSGLIDTQNRTYRELWYVDFDDASEAEPVGVREAPGLPRYGDPYTEDRFSLVTSIEPEAIIEAPGRWHVHVTYNTRTPEQLDTNNPLLQPTRWSQGYRTTQKVLRRRYETSQQGQNTLHPILNSRNQPYDPDSLPQREYNHPTIVAVRNEPANPIYAAVAFADYRNIDAVLDGLFEPGQLKVQITGTRHVHHDPQVSYWETTYEFASALGPDGWDTSVQDMAVEVDPIAAGIHQGPPMRTEDLAGNPREQLLDGNGGELAAGADPVLLPVQKYPRRAFGPLLAHLQEMP